MAITNNNVNSSYNNLQSQLMLKMLQSMGNIGGLDLDISGELSGGNSLSSINMSEMNNMMSMMLQVVMMGKMFETMGMDNPFGETPTNEKNEGDINGGGNSNNPTNIVKPGTKNIVANSKITIGDSKDLLVNSISNDSNGTLQYFSIQDGITQKWFKRVDEIGINKQNDFSNVFIEVDATSFENGAPVFTEKTDGKRYYYSNGKMLEIDNLSFESAGENLSDKTGKRIALGATVYEINVATDGTITLKDVEKKGADKIATLVDDQNGKLVYKIGNITYEVIGGVFVARSTKIEKGSTIEITDLDGTTDASKTVTDYSTDKKIVIGDTTYTKYTDKKYKTTLVLYKKEGTDELYSLSGTELKQINGNDPEYLKDYGNAVSEFGINELGLKTIENTQFYEVMENNKRILKAYSTGENGLNGDVTNNLDIYNEITVSGTSNKYSIVQEGNDYNIKIGDKDEAAILTKANTTNNNMKDNIYKCNSTTTEADGIFDQNAYYKFEGGNFTRVEGAALFDKIGDKSIRISGNNLILYKVENGSEVKETYEKQTGEQYRPNIYKKDNDYYELDINRGKLEKINSLMAFKTIVQNGVNYTYYSGEGYENTYEFKKSNTDEYMSLILITNPEFCDYLKPQFVNRLYSAYRILDTNGHLIQVTKENQLTYFTKEVL